MSKDRLESDALHSAPGGVYSRATAEEALRESEARYRTVIDAMAEGIILLYADGTIGACNAAAERFLGLTVDQMMGRQPLLPGFATFHEDGTDFPPEEYPGVIALRTGRPQDRVIIGVKRPDGSRGWISVNSRPLLREGESRPYASVSSFVDITEDKKLREQLLQSQKMELIGRLAGGIAHDFNNLLAAIMGYCEIAQKQADAQSPIRQSVDQIALAASRGADLTRQLLGLARKQVITPRACDLNVLAAGMAPMLRRLIGEDIELLVEAQQPLWPVRIDPIQFEQILVNLVVNSRDAMPDGGTVTIRTSNVSAAGAAEGLAGQDHVQLEVTDTGMGMEEAVRKRLFEPFFTTKEVGKGTGLGLATCLGIVQQNGGSIEVRSSPGNGATVRVCLPRALEAAAVPTPALQPPAPRGGETVLLVEDDPMVRRFLAMTLSDLGYVVLEASDGPAAIEIAQTHSAQIHLLISDVVMPRLSGRQLTEQIRALRPGTRVLFISGYARDSFARDGILEPGVAFLQKPFTTASLAEKIRQTLEQPA